PNLKAAMDRSCLIVVHTNGVHYCNLQYCRCLGAEDSHIQLMMAGITMWNCGTLAMNFYSKLQRITSNAFPHLVLHRYRELLRVSRMWQLLKLLK
ncbi:hypothetical protein BKA82DRAFT_152794, partial [Pisolithus tinctorius]